jgi:hypothetical protein
MPGMYSDAYLGAGGNVRVVIVRFSDAERREANRTLVL